MVRDLKIRDHRLSVFLDLHILGIVFSNGNAGIDDIGNGHHDLFDPGFQILLLLLQLCQMIRGFCHLLLHFLGLFLLSLAHQSSDLLGDLVSAGSQVIGLFLYFSVFFVQGDHFVHQWQLGILEFIPDILFNDLRVFSDESQI